MKDADVARLYRSLRLVRDAEEAVARIYPSDKIKSPVHLSIGQEAVSVGVIDALEASDVVSGSYRGHAVYLAKGGSLPAFFAELYGKRTGCAGGRGGSMHLIAPEANVLGASSVVGTHIPVSVGHALALAREGKGRIVVVFMGDGATEEGVFYESLNFAALHRLPILFVCENNGFAIHTPLRKRWASQSLCERVSSFGVPTEHVGEADIFAVRRAAAAAIARVRSGEGPAFLECATYRWCEHVGPGQDFEAGYRPRSELQPWLDDDQVERLARMLPADTRAAIDSDVTRAIAAAVEFAENSPFPGAEELTQYVFAN